MRHSLVTSSAASFNPTQSLRRVLALGTLFAVGALLADEASAQFSQRPGGYIGSPHMRLNFGNGSVHFPGQVVLKASGAYPAIGGGIYQNPVTGNKYNPDTGAYHATFPS